MDANQPNGDLKIFTEELCDSECHNKYVDSLPSEANNSFIITKSPGQDSGSEVKDMYPDAHVVHLTEPSAICLSNTRTDKDNKVEFSTDVNFPEHKRSGLLESCVDADGNAVKDICIDEGVKHVADNIYPTESEEFSSQNEKDYSKWPVPVRLKSSPDVGCESEVLGDKEGLKDETKNVILSDILKDKDADTFSLQNTSLDASQLTLSIENECKDEQDVGHATHKDSLTEHEVACGKLVASGPSPEETNDDSTVETSDKKTEVGKESTNESSFLTSVNNNEVELGLTTHRQMPTASCTPPLRDPFIFDSEDLLTSASAPLQRDQFESSFASVGHYPSSITYSGQIAHSGSLSHRSDASTTSTRSFAFPVLKNEWNFSPVRMRKADRRRIRCRRWMHGVICCKF